ncbi:unnamed protein product [Mytilus coruscus]|uniref:Uncharacterized protein n=1 Tax=Mytilus coruscus TaxID=42192 RepID=A0A6J8BFD3_MYTCO|nr:unnamed protein product [Mytilus coruscus]
MASNVFGLFIWIHDDPIQGNVLNLSNITIPRKTNAVGDLVKNEINTYFIVIKSNGENSEIRWHGDNRGSGWLRDKRNSKWLVDNRESRWLVDNRESRWHGDYHCHVAQFQHFQLKTQFAEFHNPQGTVLAQLSQQADFNPGTVSRRFTWSFISDTSGQQTIIFSSTSSFSKFFTVSGVNTSVGSGSAFILRIKGSLFCIKKTLGQKRKKNVAAEESSILQTKYPKTALPQAPYVLTAEEKKEADRRLSDIKVPVNFGIIPATLFQKIVGGTKCHTWLQRTSLVNFLLVLEEAYGTSFDMTLIDSFEQRWHEALCMVERDFPAS